MMWKLLKSNKGSTLVMVLITITVLSTLGLALMSFAVANFKLNIADRNSKKAFYIAEAGLDEMYAKIQKKIESVTIAARTKADKDMKSAINDEKNWLAANDQTRIYIYLNKSVDGSGKLQYNGLNEVAINAELQTLFYSEYDKQMEKSDDGDSIPDWLESLGSANIDIRDIVTTDDIVNKICLKFVVDSQSNVENIQKKVSTQFALNIPNYADQYYMQNQYLAFKDTPLWTKALVAKGNINAVNCGNVTINGDIYAGAQEPNGTDDPNGGILVKSRSSTSSLQVNGRTVTPQNIKTMADNSNINLMGDVYCNNIIIPDSVEAKGDFAADGNVVNCNITVGQSGADPSTKFNVSVKDDLELNGTSSHINIYGSYYGFMDDGSSNTADLSSAIVINSSDITGNDGSSLTITGVSDGNIPIITRSIPKEDGIFIAGTGYVNNNNPIKYKTGESVAIRGNYLTLSHSNAISLSSVNDDAGTFDFDESLFRKTVYEDIQPLTFATKYEKDNGLVTLYARQKSLLMKEVKRLWNQKSAPEKPYPLYIDNVNVNIDPNNVKYSLGAYITKDGANSRLFTDNYTNDYSDLIQEIEYEYKLYTNRMGDPQITDISAQASDLNTKVGLSDYINFGLTLIKKPIETVTDPNGITKDKVFYLNPGTNDVIIRGHNIGNNVGELTTAIKKIDPNDDIYNLSSKNAEGIIITKGDVFIEGEIDFKGIIVAEGNINFFNSANITITNNDFNDKMLTTDNNYLVRTVYEHLKDTASDENVGDRFKILDAPGTKKLNLYDINAGIIDPSIKSYRKYADLIQFYEWKKIQ